MERNHSRCFSSFYHLPRVSNQSSARFSGSHSANHRAPKKSKGTYFNSNRNYRLNFKKCNRSSKRFSYVVPFSYFRYPQKLRGSSCYFEPQTNQSVHSCSTLQDGNTFCHSPTDLNSRLGCDNRPEGCLPACSCTSGFAPPSGVLISEPDVFVPGLAVRTEGLALGIHQVGGYGDCIPPSSGDSNILLPGRLVDCSEFKGPPSCPSQEDSGGFPETRLSHQLEEVISCSTTASCVPGRSSRDSPSSSTPSGPPDLFSSAGHPRIGVSEFSTSLSVAKIPWSFVQPGGFGPQLQTSHETSSTAPSAVFQSRFRPGYSPDSHASQHQDIGSTVVVSGTPVGGEALCPPSSKSHVDNRRIQVGVGSCSDSSSSIRSLVQGGISGSHQLPRAAGCVPSAAEFRESGEGSVGPGSVGQHDGGCVHQSSGGYAFPVSVSTCDGSMGVVYTSTDPPLCYPYTRRGQSSCRLPIEGEIPPIGMEVEDFGLSENLSYPVSIARDRPVCLSAELPSSQVLFSQPGSGCLESRCNVLPMVRSASLCISSVLDDPQSVGKDRPGRSGGSVDSSSLAEETMVSQAFVSPSRPSQGAPVSERSHHSAHISALSSKNRKPTSLSLAALRRQGKEAGLSDRAAEFSAEAIRDSTRATYDSKLECFFKWCERISCNPSSASLGQVADFLIHLFDKGLSPSTIRLYRSAIASCHSGFEDGSSISSSQFLSRMIRAFYLKRPRTKSLIPSWSLPAVLQALAKEPFEPMYKASLHHLTLKTVFLVAIASGHRVSTLQALSVEPGHIRWEASGVRLVPRADFIAKNQTHSSPLVEIFLPSLSSFSSVSEDKVWCPVRALRWYLDKMKPKRTSSSLFVTHIEPFKAASKPTISRWIVECIKTAGSHAILTDRIRAHDTRSVSTSWALFQGASLSDIQAAAYWSIPNTFISCYLKDVLRGEAAFASAVFKAVSKT